MTAIAITENTANLESDLPKVKVAIFMMALSTLLIELLLIKVFDVILEPNMAYMIVTCAMFSFGIAGVYGTLRPLKPSQGILDYAGAFALICAITIVAIRPVFNILPFDYTELAKALLTQILAFLGMYLVLVATFFSSGLIFVSVFSNYPDQIQSLYYWDLVGAGIGCLMIIPFLSVIGPGGLLYWAAALVLLAGALFIGRRPWLISLALLAGLFVVFPLLHYPEYYDFGVHINKRGVQKVEADKAVEITRWDPISKIDVIPITATTDTDENAKGTSKIKYRHIAYDGGQQSSHFYPFDGNFKALRESIESGRELIGDHFWFWGVPASHYLKRDQGQKVLIIGSAGGQETKAALMYGAGHVDAIELVGEVVNLGQNEYAAYIGNIFNDPRVSVRRGEGRSFLRASKERYDIIEIFSNHTSSSIAQGTAAMDPTYLQTVEAYMEYFQHLKDDGILHINHHIYPKMIPIAAAAWAKLGKADFQKHVVVFERALYQDNLPTVLIKMQPWTEQEINELKKLQGLPGESGKIVENPLDPASSFLTPEFYSGELSEELQKKAPFRLLVSTDDRPYFNFLRKHIAPIEPDAKVFLNSSTAGALNSSLKYSVPMDIIHLVVTSFVSLVCVVLFILIPMYFSEVGRTKWSHKGSVLTYFACLGAGFIIIELTFIHIFMKLIGFPLYSYSTVIFALLLSAGVGSLWSGKLDITPERRWLWPFIGVLVAGGVLLFLFPYVADRFLASPTPVRILVSSILIFPLGFFLGMPFPLGISTIKNMPQGAVAWAWSLNSVFTVVGGLSSVLLSVFLGFKVTILIALGIYVLALVMYARIRHIAAMPA